MYHQRSDYHRRQSEEDHLNFEENLKIVEAMEQKSRETEKSDFNYASAEVMEQDMKFMLEGAKAYLEEYKLPVWSKEDLPRIVKNPEEEDARIHDEGKMIAINGNVTFGGHIWFNDDRSIEEYQRRSRGFDACGFGGRYKFVGGKKIFVSSKDITYWSAKCYDSFWVAVHGMESICMVTRRRDVDMTRVDPYYQTYCTSQQTMRSYAEAVICEVESLPYGCDTLPYDLGTKLGPSIEKPFSIVSVVPVTVHGERQASNDHAAEDEAANFLKKKMRSGLAFTCDETIQTAISAFQHLCPLESKAEDIWVTTLSIPRNSYEHMHIDQIKEHLAVIRGFSSGVSISGRKKGRGWIPPV